MVQNIGIFNCYRINYPCWYLSVLMFASILIFGFFKISSKAVRIGVSVGCVLLIYSYIFLSYRQLENFDTVFIFYIPFWRGVSDLLLGALAYDLQLALSKGFFERNIQLTRITECACFLGISVLLFIDLPVDLILAFLIFILITAVSSPHSVINRLSDNEVFKWLIKYEYAIFLNHALVIDAMTHLPLHLWYSRLAVLALLLITYSVSTTKLVDLCCGILKKLSAKLFKKQAA